MIVLRILKKCLLTNNNGDMTIDTEFNVGDSVCYLSGDDICYSTISKITIEISY